MVAGLAGALYLTGVRRLRARGRSWPVGRSAAMAGAVAAGLVATQSGIARHDDDLFWVHMIEHVLLGMVVPLLMVLAAPMTLALRTGAVGTRRVLRTALHSAPGRFLVRPLVGWLLFGGGLVGLYLTPLLDLAARDDLVHLLVHAHVVVAGTLFLAPIAGVDALPRRPPFPARLLALLVAVPFHALVAMALLSATSPVAPRAYPSLGDQRTAAAIFWASGEVLTLVVAAIVSRQWWVSEQRAAAREDRLAAAGQP